MNTREFAQRLRAGGLLCGTLIVSPSPMWPAALEDSGLDFVFIDTEHIALFKKHLRQELAAIKAAAGLAPSSCNGPETLNI